MSLPVRIRGAPGLCQKARTIPRFAPTVSTRSNCPGLPSPSPERTTPELGSTGLDLQPAIRSGHYLDFILVSFLIILQIYRETKPEVCGRYGVMLWTLPVVKKQIKNVSASRPILYPQPFESHKDANPLVNYNFDEQTPNPNQMRWKPFDIPAEPTDFVQVRKRVIFSPGIFVNSIKSKNI